MQQVLFPLGLYVLSGADLRHLKKLKIHLMTGEEEPGVVSRKISRALVQRIKSTSNLEDLCSECFTFDLKDMESIHAHAPNLKCLESHSTELDSIPDTDSRVSRDCS